MLLHAGMHVEVSSVVLSPCYPFILFLHLLLWFHPSVITHDSINPVLIGFFFVIFQVHSWHVKLHEVFIKCLNRKERKEKNGE